VSWRLTTHDSLPSTQNLLTRLAEAGEPAGLAVLAHRQTAGRGQGVRIWDSRPGNLHLSILLRPSGPARDLPGWALLFAVALHEAALTLVAPERLCLKWPNDLLLDGAKVGGILAEAELTAAGEIAWLAAGFGVNLAHAPAIEGRATAALGAIAPEVFAERLLDRLDRWQGIHASEGMGRVRDAWLASGPKIGEVLTLRRDGEALSGHFAGLAEDGALLLSTNGRLQAFHSGEIGG
jgi:BirA family biotin operon repressor/biotin-[acetyl-CoA-carboxylase] ligase